MVRSTGIGLARLDYLFRVSTPPSGEGKFFCQRLYPPRSKPRTMERTEVDRYLARG